MGNKTDIPRTRDAYHYWAPVTLRFSDQDPMGHVNNVAVSALLEAGRVVLLNDVFEGSDRSKFSIVLANLYVDFLHEMLYPDTVNVGGRLVSTGNRSMTSQFAIFQGERCCVVSQSINVFFDTATRKSAPPPDDVSALVKQHLEKSL